MDSTISCQDFILNKTVVNSELTDFMSAIRCLAENNYQGIIYHFSEILSIFNIDVLKIDSNGDYFYDFKLYRDCDMIEDIKLSSKINFKYSFIIGNIEFQPENLNLIPIASLFYNECLIRITFKEKPKMDDIINITMDKYLFNSRERKELMNSNFKIGDYIVSEGICNINKN